MTALRMLLMVILQAFILRDVTPFGEWTRPEWALWALLLVPPQASPFLKLLSGFAMGTALDVAMGTYGQHMVAGTALGGALPALHRLFSPREGYEVTDRPTLQDMGSSWLIGFTLSAAVLYHLVLMVVSNWYWHLLPSAILPSLTSAAFTTMCCVVLHMMVYSPDRRNPTH
jgi:hypothetical protein